MRLTPNNAKLTLSGSPRSLTSWQHSVDIGPFRPLMRTPIQEKSLMKFAALISRSAVTRDVGSQR
jgi:hypothetical protein